MKKAKKCWQTAYYSIAAQGWGILPLLEELPLFTGTVPTDEEYKNYTKE